MGRKGAFICGERLKMHSKKILVGTNEQNLTNLTHDAIFQVDVILFLMSVQRKATLNFRSIMH